MKNFSKKTWFYIVVLLSVMIVDFIVFAIYFQTQTTIKSSEKINISNSTCSVSKHIGRKIFLHICLKNKQEIFDIRYFFSNRTLNPFPEIIGVQLTKREFRKVCEVC